MSIKLKNGLKIMKKIFRETTLGTTFLKLKALRRAIKACNE